jgi:MFS family permease
MSADVSRFELPRILQMVSINGFALGLVSIFIPIYLLKLGYSVQSVMLWMFILHTSLLIFCFLAVYFSNKFGLVRTLQTRFAFLLTHLILLLVLPNFRWLFPIIPIIIGLEGAFYWMPLNILLVRNTESQTMGESVGKLAAYPQIFSIWCPLVGGLVAGALGFTTLFIVAMAIVGLAVIPLLPLQSQKTSFKFTLGNAREIFHKNKQFIVPEIVDNFMEDAGVIWSIFVYLKLTSITQIGIIGTIGSIVAILFTLSIGKLTDKWNKHKLIKIGAVLISLIWIFQAAMGQNFPNVWLFYIATIGMTLSLKTFLIPYSSIIFNQAREDDAQFIVLREVPVVLGRLLLYGMAALLSDHLSIIFVLVGIVFIYFWFLDTKRLTLNHARTA